LGLARTTQDEELAVTQRNPSSSPALPSPDQVVALLTEEFARAGYEIDDVLVDARAQPPRIRIVADGDTPLDLETIAELSRRASALLDTLDTGQTAYLLEVSSPGVDRPLTDEKHFRRARGRRIEVSLNDGTGLAGRLGLTADGVAEIVVPRGRDWEVLRLSLADIRKAVVQVEFSPPSARELEHLGGTGRKEAGG